MNLPPRSNGSPLTIDTARRRQIVIIGANGAGKTRFADYLAAVGTHYRIAFANTCDKYNRFFLKSFFNVFYNEPVS